MFTEYSEASRVHVDRNDEGTVRGLLHVEEPYLSSARTAQQAAHEYLAKYSDMLGLTAEELKHLSLPPDNKPTEDQIEYRFLEEKPQFDMTTVVFNQTVFGLPVWEDGIAVHTQQNPFRVLSAQSTTHADLEVRKPTERAINRI